jgi:hypothetical protein
MQADLAGELSDAQRLTGSAQDVEQARATDARERLMSRALPQELVRADAGPVGVCGHGPILHGIGRLYLIDPAGPPSPSGPSRGCHPGVMRPRRPLTVVPSPI